MNADMNESEQLAERVEELARQADIHVVSHETIVFKTAFFDIGTASEDFDRDIPGRTMVRGVRRFIFTTLAIGAMPKPEGSTAPGGVEVREAAIDGFLNEASEWLKQRRAAVGEGATLAWRKLPEVRELEDGRWQVVCRVAVA